MADQSQASVMIPPSSQSSSSLSQSSSRRRSNPMESLSQEQRIKIEKLKSEMVYYTLPKGTELIRGVVSGSQYWPLFEMITPDDLGSPIKYYAYFENNKSLYPKSRKFIENYLGVSGKAEAVKTKRDLKLLHLSYYLMNDDDEEVRDLIKNYKNLIKIADILYKGDKKLVVQKAIHELLAGDVPNPYEPKEQFIKSDLVSNILVYDAGFEGWVRFSIDKSGDTIASEVAINDPDDKVTSIDIKTLDDKYLKDVGSVGSSSVGPSSVGESFLDQSSVQEQIKVFGGGRDAYYYKYQKYKAKYLSAKNNH